MKNYKLRITQTAPDTQTNVTINANKEGLFNSSVIKVVSDKLPIVCGRSQVVIEGEYNQDKLKDYQYFTVYIYLEKEITTLSRENISITFDKDELIADEWTSFSEITYKEHPDVGGVPVRIGYINFGIKNNPEYTIFSDNPLVSYITISDATGKKRPSTIEVPITVVGAGPSIVEEPPEPTRKEKILEAIPTEYLMNVTFPEGWTRNWNDLNFTYTGQAGETVVTLIDDSVQVFKGYISSTFKDDSLKDDSYVGDCFEVTNCKMPITSGYNGFQRPYMTDEVSRQKRGFTRTSNSYGSPWEGISGSDIELKSSQVKKLEVYRYIYE